MARTKYSYRGIDGLKAIAAKYGINPETLRQRIVNQGMSITAAINAGDGRFSQKEAREKRKVNYHLPRQQVGIKHPDLLSQTWKLALGIGAPQ
ncbi:hypothetical protein [Vibrio gazogenes]|uniref:Uncharacterized protein n=1 Tax=Vibrio gazogenes DSM 21264 = NBRC 103151 TaxID=1123492 RepID=A0A1M5F747_VIBGA|nr:hypothetical protein [Vibrio gazogenes]USP15438.1 hypothetical protein MKS89_18740 [Vibrio gazogenes]SHF87393.1 hypothetical protein SAMN02745781_03377 [Vibrio gazogenes DSM 21264] [Vibrio gazogenes DSM 21264 = NBRC 103151]SJN54499.1 hypothetical protein BQ6471_01040 [Vibrio gazogenes]